MTTDLPLLTAPVLDESALQTIRELDEDGGDGLLREILAAYFASCPALLADMESGLANADAEKVRIATHTLKSSSASLGATRLAALCKEAETAARAGDLASVSSLAIHLSPLYEQTCEALTRSVAG